MFGDAEARFRGNRQRTGSGRVSPPVDFDQKANCLPNQLRRRRGWFFTTHVLQQGKPLVRIPRHRLGDGANVRVPKKCIKGAFRFEPVTRIIRVLKVLLHQKRAIAGLDEEHMIVPRDAERLEADVITPAGALQRCEHDGFTHTAKIVRTSGHDATTVRPGFARTARAGSKRMRCKSGGRSGSARNSGRSSMK